MIRADFGRSPMLVGSWWRGRRRPHSSYVVELGVIALGAEPAHALGLTIDTLAYRLVRTRPGAAGQAVETADLILPVDRWTIRLQNASTPRRALSGPGGAAATRM
ncbi:hypothetical protein ACIRPT_03175 [Streptomyces sp. NPDC101227]|uniref:hypothetical protein n=1 Tax=Streptomyces sp. NPDC101227 TaxID=3366136 RepID=UPI0038077C32